MPSKKTSREQIIYHAIQVFRERGYHRTSIKDLGEVCNIQKAHFYYYFENGKSQLMAEVLESVLTYFEERVFVHAYNEELTAEERLDKMAEKMLRAYLGGKGGCIMGNTVLETAHLGDEPRLLAITKRFFDAMHAALTHIYALRDDEVLASDKAWQVIQDIEGALIMYQLYEDQRFMARSLGRCLELLKVAD